MLDAEGYPHAFLDAHGMRLEFRRVSQRSDGLHADVRIIPITPQQSFKRHFLMTIEIAGRHIGLITRHFVIAEMSGNHNQSLDRALAIVNAAAQAGVHAMQTYTADTMTLNVRGGSFN